MIGGADDSELHCAEIDRRLDRDAERADPILALQQAAIAETERQIEADRAALLFRRDLILASLKTQFAAKVAVIAFKADARTLDTFLLDLANNIAQGLS